MDVATITERPQSFQEQQPSKLEVYTVSEHSLEAFESSKWDVSGLSRNFGYNSSLELQYLADYLW